MQEPILNNDTFRWHTLTYAPRTPARSLQSVFREFAARQLEFDFSSSRFMNIVCLAIDGLHIGFVGCYGSDSVPTPAMDHLASEAFVFDQYIIDSPDPVAVYPSLWQGIHALSNATGGDNIAAVLSAADWSTTLVSDDARWFDRVATSGFRHLNMLPPAEDRAAESLSKTGFARFFETAVDVVAGVERSEFVWLHSHGMTAPWDAPYSLRCELIEDEEEPSPPEMSTVPTIPRDRPIDPDELLGIRRAYGGQIKLFDECLAAFLEMFESSGLADDTLLVLLGVRGFPLGEHSVVGLNAGRLHEELIHVPCLMRFPDGMGAGHRGSAIVQPSDVPATLLDWVGHDVSIPHGQSLLPLIRGERSTLRDRAGTVTHDSNGPTASNSMEIAIRTHYWQLDFPPPGEHPAEDVRAERPLLYVKPDDRWEQNEISSRCPDQVEALRTAIDDLKTAIQGDNAKTMSPLDECLRYHPT